ncbi:glycosyltransferase [Glycomyces paridis]|uniref:Glycosyltransferase family 4 protein n=1 Tax=Glycomyces paridis TaxID=2126555 RepID=A0A4S8PVN4_9ACTN|nr:glycosyltransferase [Glycomyces paridis]THV31984.1 glycosyltransferase family 4 protein [Glycomyces paridis]
MSADRPRLLYLAFYFPPSRASGVYRARATADHFAAAGWDVTVMRAPDRFYDEVTGSTDPALADGVDPAVTVLAPGMDFFAWETDLARYGRLRGNAPATARRLHEWKLRRVFPEVYHSWASRAVALARRLHRREPFDLVLATGNPFASFAAAWAISRLTGLPYIMDYRDSWTLDLFANADAYPPGHPAWKWERRVMARAGAAVFVNDALRDWHAERYPAAAERMMTVPNGWDPDCLDPLAAGAPGTGPLSYAYVGTLTVNQPVRCMVDGFRAMTAAGDHPDATLDLWGHLGFFTHSPARLRADFGLEFDGEGDVRYRGPVSKTAVGEAYAEADVLVFLAGGSKYVTSGKIFEYMAVGKPIVSVHEPGSAAEPMLRDYPLWFRPKRLDAEEVARAMAEAGDAARSADEETRGAARSYGAAFTRDAALRPLQERARELAGGRR